MYEANLKKGDIVSFYGTVYVVSEDSVRDTVVVHMDNGIALNLWFPEVPGCKVLKRKGDDVSD